MSLDDDDSHNIHKTVDLNLQSSLCIVIRHSDGLNYLRVYIISHRRKNKVLLILV